MSIPEDESEAASKEVSLTDRPASSRTVARPRNEKLSETVARGIVSDLISGGVQPQTMLSTELALAERYGVGRSSVREALRILEVPGIVQMRHGARGGPMFVGADSESLARTMSLFFALSNVTIGDLYEARRSIEPLAARLAAENSGTLSSEDFAVWFDQDNAVDQPESASDLRGADPERDYAQAMLGFHQLISASCGNRLLDLLCQAVVTLLDRSLTEMGFEAHFDTATRHEVDRVHRRIAEAILSGDGAEAERLTAAHLRSHESAVKLNTPWVWARPIRWI